jgi:hypothetical protein
MTKIIDGFKAAGVMAIMGAGTIVVMTVAPLVSLVAVPIFTIIALSQWVKHRSLYNRTLTNGIRSKFGRIEGQDYTRWDGKAVVQIKTNPTWQEQMHELMNAYVHGKNHRNFEIDTKQVIDYPFQTKEDLDWLNREFSRRKKKDLLDGDFKMLRAFSKALIPIAGVIWVLFSEIGAGGASSLGCSVCMLGADSEDKHWGWKEAIDFHEKILLRKLYNT